MGCWLTMMGVIPFSIVLAVVALVSTLIGRAVERRPSSRYPDQDVWQDPRSTELQLQSAKREYYRWGLRGLIGFGCFIVVDVALIAVLQQPSTPEWVADSFWYLFLGGMLGLFVWEFYVLARLLPLKQEIAKLKRR